MSGSLRFGCFTANLRRESARALRRALTVVGACALIALAACAPPAGSTSTPVVAGQVASPASRAAPSATGSATDDAKKPSTDPPAESSSTPQLGMAAVATPTGDATATQWATAYNADAMADMIRVTQPLEGAPVSSPLVIRGEARGMWFFEASFPITLEAADGSELGVAIATALGDWMTEEFVPFEAILIFEATPHLSSARLVLAKDNPSGLAEHDAQLIIPVRLDR